MEPIGRLILSNFWPERQALFCIFLHPFYEYISLSDGIYAGLLVFQIVQAQCKYCLKLINLANVTFNVLLFSLPLYEMHLPEGKKIKMLGVSPTQSL